MSPQAIEALGVDGLRNAGTTRQKAGYVVGIAERILSDEFDPAELEAMPVEEARSRARDCAAQVKVH